MSLFLPFIENSYKFSEITMESRMFIPGSEWVYFKIYTGTKTADAILKKEIFRYVKGLMGLGCDIMYFFVSLSPIINYKFNYYVSDYH